MSSSSLSHRHSTAPASTTSSSTDFPTTAAAAASPQEKSELRIFSEPESSCGYYGGTTTTSMQQRPSVETASSASDNDKTATSAASIFEEIVTSDEADILHAPSVDAQALELERVEDPFEMQEKLGVLPFAVIIFYSVSGGAFGVEETVRSAGNFYTLLGFLVMPFLWSLQEALMTTELGSAFPEASGGVAWVQEAFGDCAGWMSGFLGWVSGATDNAIYPVLFVDYLLEVLKNGDDEGGDDRTSIPFPIRFLLLSGLSCALAYMNWLGLSLVGKMSMTISFVALSPFLILTIVGAFQVDPARWFEPPAIIPEDNISSQSNNSTHAVVDDDSAPIGLFTMAALQRIAWRPFLNNLFWNLNSFDSAASFAADIDDPARTLPRAMGLAFLMVSACYFVPLLVALGATHAKQCDWVDGYFSVAARTIAGRWLQGWLVFAAGISNIGLFQAELSSDAFQLMGMAERGFLPRIFATRSWHGTPTYGILLGLVVIICMTVTDLDNLIEMLNLNYSFSLLLEYFAFLKLRVTRPHLDRPYRIPLNTVGCLLVFTPTIVTIVLVICLASWKTLAFGLLVNIIGLLIFFVKDYKTLKPYTEITGARGRHEFNGHDVAVDEGEFKQMGGRLT